MNVPLPHEIVLVPSAGKSGREQLLQQCHDIRIDVFRREMGSSSEDEVDNLDDTSEHFLLRLVPSLLPIGTIRVSRTSSGGVPCYSLGRFAILTDYRKYGFGSELVQTLHEWVIADSQSRGEKIATIFCLSLVTLKSFYARFGYTPEGDEFMAYEYLVQKLVVHLSP